MLTINSLYIFKLIIRKYKRYNFYSILNKIRKQGLTETKK